MKTIQNNKANGALLYGMAILFDDSLRHGTEKKINS